MLLHGFFTGRISHLFAFTLLLSSLLSAPSAKSQMSVYPMMVLLNEQGSGQIRVLSKSDDIQFVKTSIEKVLNPGMPTERQVNINVLEEEGIIATPQKFALAAGTQRIIRLMTAELPEKETTWRVYFQGVNSLEDDSAKSSPDLAMSGNLGINIIWGVLIHLPPKTPVVALSLNKSTGQVFNEGTMHVTLKEFGICNSDEDCRWINASGNIYPDGHKTIPALKTSAPTYKIRYHNWIKNTNEEMNLAFR